MCYVFIFVYFEVIRRLEYIDVVGYIMYIDAYIFNSVYKYRRMIECIRS